jgi:hypothetical protein
VRHVRMLGLCLIALFAASIIAAVPALAKETKEEKFVEKVVSVLKNCNYKLSTEEQEFCFAGVTNGGKKGGFFQLGGVTVPLSKPITLQGGLHRSESEEGFVVPPATGATLESPELTLPGGLSLITPRIQEEEGWPAELKALWKEAIKNHESGMKVKVELAGGNKLYETAGALDISNLIIRSGAAFKLPLKVRMISPVLERLGGGPCEVGNESTPVWQYLTTEESQDGWPGFGAIADDGSVIELSESRLADNSWVVEEEAVAKGCGGPYEEFIDNAMNRLLNLREGRNYVPEHGSTVLTGHLYLAFHTIVQEHLEG